MILEPLRPARGGFLRPFGCGWFIREFLSGSGPYGSPVIDPAIGAPQADVFYYYRQALCQATALDRATRAEEKRAKREKRSIDPDNIDTLTQRLLARLPSKGRSTYHSFVVYFSNLRRLGWVEFSGIEEPSAFQENYPAGPPRRYYRLTAAGAVAGEAEWSDPRATLYGGRIIW